MKGALMDPQSGRLLPAGMGCLVISDDPGDTLAAYALGSCLGVAAWDPRLKVGGLLHFMLPESSLNPQKAAEKPGTFCDSGLEALFQSLEALGSSRSRLRLHLAGAARVLDSDGYFDIGRRNALAARRRLWELGLLVEDEDLGGDFSRTLKLRLQDGRVTVRDSFGERELRRSIPRRA